MGTKVAGEAAAFDALADGYRREILAMLREGDRAVHEIAQELPISRPAVSRHLRLLKEAGFVEEETVGTRHLYHLRDEGIEAVRRYLETVWGEAATRFRIVAENVDGEIP
jgi:DNA-binding transcriptional ArsR family regulator